MLIAICITILVYSILGKDIHSLLEEVKDSISPEIHRKVEDVLTVFVQDTSYDKFCFWD